MMAAPLEDSGHALAELIGSSLLQRLVPDLALCDLQSLQNVNKALRAYLKASMVEWLDVLAQLDWRKICGRSVPASHPLAGVTTGLTTAV